jgi:hypothetical protein
MAKGKQGLYLESWKFAVYLAVPIAASWYYSDPQRQKESADYWQYVKYPANPNVNMKEQIEALAAQQKQRNAYREQMKELQAQAARTEQRSQEETSRRGWWSWIGFGRKKNATEN